MNIYDLLRAARDYEPPTRLHPLVIETYDAYDAHGRRLPPRTLDGLGQALDALEAGGLSGLIELADVFFGLAVFAWFLEDKLEDALSAEAVREFIRTRRDLYAWIVGQLELARQEERRFGPGSHARLVGRAREVQARCAAGRTRV